MKIRRITSYHTKMYIIWANCRSFTHMQKDIGASLDDSLGDEYLVISYLRKFYK